MTVAPKIHSNKIDDILTGVTPKTPEFAQESQAEAQEASAPEQQPEQVNDETVTPEMEHKNEEKEPEKEAPKVEETKAAQKDEHVDEYGNSTEKPRVYTEDEVQRMIKERLERIKLPKGEAHNVQKSAQDFQVDPNSTDDWQVQLENFIDQTIEKRESIKTQREWEHREKLKQEEFETKFTSGMNKYTDFRDVVGKMPITDSIMMATREMNDPAAFLYAASKLHPEELKNIAAMQDPFSQARELGRLDERMKKARAISNSPPPLSKTTGDMPTKYVQKHTIEDRIHQYAKVKRR